MLKIEKLNHLPILQDAIITEKTVRLATQEALTVKQNGQSICVHSGLVWITVDNRDHFIGRGEHFHLGQSKAKAVISSANKNAIQIEIQAV